MEDSTSKSERKRRFKAVEQLARELAGLSAGELAGTPCEPQIKEEILLAQGQKGGAKNRQIKHVAKLLRQDSIEELMSFLQKKKGSQLKKNMEFHELERLRDAIINEAIEAYSEREAESRLWDGSWSSKTVDRLADRYATGFDPAALEKAAWLYASTRKIAYAREIFRMLKAVFERSHFDKAGDKEHGI